MGSDLAGKLRELAQKSEDGDVYPASCDGTLIAELRALADQIDATAEPERTCAHCAVAVFCRRDQKWAPCEHAECQPSRKPERADVTEARARPAEPADRSKIDPRPTCIRCGRRWVPAEGVDATVTACCEPAASGEVAELLREADRLDAYGEGESRGSLVDTVKRLAAALRATQARLREMGDGVDGHLDVTELSPSGYAAREALYWAADAIEAER